MYAYVLDPIVRQMTEKLYAAPALLILNLVPPEFDISVDSISTNVEGMSAQLLALRAIVAEQVAQDFDL